MRYFDNFLVCAAEYEQEINYDWTYDETFCEVEA